MYKQGIFKVLMIGVPKTDPRLLCSDCVYFRQESIAVAFGKGCT